MADTLNLNRTKFSSGDNIKATNNYTLPPKPYTEYTIFFRLERTYILQSSGIIDEEVASFLDPSHCDPVEFPRPARYENLALPPYWYSSSHKAAVEKKRKHRKRAGRMDLRTLSKTISASWRKADPFVIKYCRKLADAELKKYNRIIEGIIKDQDEAHNNNADIRVRVQQKKPLQSKTAVPSVVTQAKQQVDNSVTMKPLFNKVAPKSTHNGASLQDVFLQKPRRVSDDLGEIMECSSSGHQNKRQEKVVIQKLQATQRHMMNIYGDTSFASLKMPSPFVNTTGDNCREHSLTSVKPSYPYANSTVFNNNAVNVNGGVHPEIILEKNKRKLARRISTLPDFMAHRNNFPVQTCMATRENIITSGVMNSGGGDAFMGVDNLSPPKRMKGRSSMVNMATNQAKTDETERGTLLYPQNLFLFNEIKDIRRTNMPSPAIQERSGSFQKEVDTGCFTYIPAWEKEVADKLLDILNAPQEVSEAMTVWEKEDADKLLDILNVPQEVSEPVAAWEKEEADELLDLLNVEVDEPLVAKNHA